MSDEPREPGASPPPPVPGVTAQQSATPSTAAPVSATGGEALALARERAQTLLEHRTWLLGIDYESSVSFDKVLVTLSAGGLALSVNLDRGPGIWLWSLQLSWAFFTASLLAMLFSYRTTRRELSEKIAETDWRLQHGDEPRPARSAPWHCIETSALNTAAVICLIAGICFLVAFAARNL